jgi:hypothetical protein
MPNFSIGSNLRKEIEQKCERLTQRRLDWAQAKFPLTVDELQSAIMKPEHLKTLRELEADIQDLPRDTGPGVYLGKDYLPDLEFDSAISMSLPASVLVPRHEHIYSSAWDKRYETRLLRFDTGVLSDEKRAAVTAWANRAVKEFRIKDAIDQSVAYIMANCKSAWHLAVFCPAIITLVEDRYFKQKFQHNFPKYPGHYAPNPELLAMNRKRVEAVEIVIAGGQLLEPYKIDREKVQAVVSSWRKHPESA